MGYFKTSNFPPHSETIAKARTIKDGEWYLDLEPSDSGIMFLAKNNKYSEYLCTVSRHGRVFNFIFGGFIDRLNRAETKYHKWIDKKNSTYFHAKQVLTIL